MTYLTSADLANKLGTTLTASQTAYLNSVLSSAIDAYIDSMTGTTFGSTTPTTVYADGDNTSILSIPTMHTITSVSDDASNVIDSTRYKLYPRASSDKLAIRSLDTWDEGNENYAIVGVLGHKNVPADIRIVALELASNALIENISGLKSESVGDWSVSYDNAVKEISSQSLGILESYTRLSRRI